MHSTFNKINVLNYLSEIRIKLLFIIIWDFFAPNFFRIPAASQGFVCKDPADQRLIAEEFRDRGVREWGRVPPHRYEYATANKNTKWKRKRQNKFPLVPANKKADSTLFHLELVLYPFFVSKSSRKFTSIIIFFAVSSLRLFFWYSVAWRIFEEYFVFFSCVKKLA